MNEEWSVKEIMIAGAIFFVFVIVIFFFGFQLGRQKTLEQFEKSLKLEIPVVD